MAKPFSGVAMSREMKCGGGRLLGRLPMSSRLRACASPASGAVLVIGVYRVQVRFASDEENIAYMVFLFFCIFITYAFSASNRQCVSMIGSCVCSSTVQRFRFSSEECLLTQTNSCTGLHDLTDLELCS